MSKPKILLFDIETFPNIGYTWGKWETDVLKFIKEWEIASVAWKFVGDKEIKVLGRDRASEAVITHRIWDLFNEADILVAHNGDEFDIKRCRTKFLQFDLDPPAMNRSIDTKKVAKSRFGFNSNSLGDLAEFLGVGKKMNTGGFDLWLECMADKREAWAKMKKYNMHDVVLLEGVFEKLRPWAINLPNMAVLDGREGCPACGSINVQSRGFTVTAKSKQRRLQCQDCGHWYTGRLNAGKTK